MAWMTGNQPRELLQIPASGTQRDRAGWGPPRGWWERGYGKPK